MAVTSTNLTITDIDSESKKYLKITDFENIFKIYIDQKGNYFYNLNASLYLDVADDILLDYICDYDMQWPLLSYKIYGTTRLAWLLMKLNKVKPADVFKLKMTGETVKYLPKDQMTGLIQSLNNIV